MDIFPFSKDIHAFLLRVTASLERADALMAEAQLTVRNANAAIDEVRDVLAAVRGAPK